MKDAYRIIFPVILLVLLLTGCNLAAGQPVPTAREVATGAASLTQDLLSTPFSTVPADSDTPAAGICLAAEGEIVEIILGSGPDGLPLGGRCIQVAADQKLMLLNRRDEAVVMTLGPFVIDLAPGDEILLDEPVGKYLEVGAHYLPDSPAIWLVEP